MSKLEKKYCRVCLREIKSRTPFTNLMQPPNPSVELRGGVNAKTYLQCYYFCMQSNSTRFNIKYLPNHPYICGICMESLMKTIEFIVKSQKNENKLKTMYDDGSAEDISSFRGENMVVSNLRTLLDDEMAELLAEENDSKEDIIEKYADEPEILEEDLQGINIFEIERLSDGNNVQVDHMEECIEEKDVKTPEDDIVEQLDNEEVISNAIVTLDEVMLPMPMSVCKKEKTQKGPMFKTVHKKSFSHNFKCLLCKRTFTFQRQLYQHYDDEHDPKLLSFPCDICRKRHVSHKALAFHKHSIHNNVEYKDCELCGQVLLPAFFKAHKDRHTTAVLVYPCDECNCTFDTECSLKQHHKDIHERNKLRVNFFSTDKRNAHNNNPIVQRFQKRTS